MSDTGYPDPAPEYANPVDASALVESVPPSAPGELSQRVAALAHPSQDAELAALVMLVTVLEPLSPAARRRVLRWSAERFTTPGVSASGE